VDGDEVDIELGVEAGAGALLATQASTKVYRSPRGCRQSLRATVGDAGALVVLPDPVVCFAGARYEQTARIDLATTSSLLFADIFTAGRSARGERWQFETYASRVQVFVEGRPVFHDATTLDAKAGPLVHRMGRFDALATVYITGPAFLPLAAKVVATPSPWQRRGDLLEVISDAQGKGALLRVAGASVEGVLRTLRDRLKPLSDVLGDDPFARKW
jgi:urease accessory protein